MESLYAWREFKARQENKRMQDESFAFSRKVKYEKSYFELPMPVRAIVIARVRLADLQKRCQSLQNDDQRENFKCEKEMWFSWLKSTMKNYRLSKEYLASFGLNWNDCKRMAYGA